MKSAIAQRPQEQPVGPRPTDDLMQGALSMCKSGKLQYVSPTRCQLRMAFTAPGDEEWWTLDLDDYLLPATKLARQCTLSEEPRLAIATVLAIDLYLCSAAVAKGTHRTIATIASTIAKCWEWGRLRGLYRAQDWTEGHFRRLEKDLGKGRWSLALKAKTRVEALLRRCPDPAEIARAEKQFSIRAQVAMLIGTNMSCQELSCAKGSVHKYVQPDRPEGDWEQDRIPSQPRMTWLLQATWAMNLVGNLPAPYGFAVTPFPDPVVRAKRLAKPNSRTKTLSIDQAVGLLLHSLMNRPGFSRHL